MYWCFLIYSLHHNNMTSAKKNTYQRRYRQEKKHCTIIFSLEQHQFLDRKAKKAGKGFGSYVRELALFKAKEEYILPYNEQTHEVKILLVRYGTNLNQISHLCNSTRKVSPEIIEQVRQQFSEMQTGIMKIYNAPIQVKELVRHTLIKTPEYSKEIENVLNEFQK